METVKNYVNGQWISPANYGMLDVENPSTAEIIAKVPLSTNEEVEKAIESAKAAFPEWSNTPVSRRADYLYDFLHLLAQNEEKIARLITEEMGKSLPDARAEFKRMYENVQTACGMPVLQQGDKLIGASYGIDGEVIRQPIGVFAMIAPFNFPAMVPFWFIPYALASGNTYVVKPSEQVPLTMQFHTELIHQSGIPAGVFNLVNGDKRVGEVLVQSPDIKGISFVGSTPIAKVIAEECAKRGKRFQAMGGAKNHLVVMPDAKKEEVVRNMLTSCFGCAGQRCMAASAIICVGDETYDEVVDLFVDMAKNMPIGNPLNPTFVKTDMIGPVISAQAKAKILSLIEEGIKEGATLALDGRNTVIKGSEKGHFIGATIFTDVKPGSLIHRTEIFGPVVVMLKAANLDEAIKIINNLNYGNGASIYTQNGYYARKFKIEVDAGMIGINVGIPAPVAYLPFGGMKDSNYSDIKAQGKDVIDFFTERKIVTERYWKED